MLEQFEVHITTIKDCPSVVIPLGGDHVTVNIEDNDGNLILCVYVCVCSVNGNTSVLIPQCDHGQMFCLHVFSPVCWIYRGELHMLRE